MIFKLYKIRVNETKFQRENNGVEKVTTEETIRIVYSYDTISTKLMSNFNQFVYLLWMKIMCKKLIYNINY